MTDKPFTLNERQLELLCDAKTYVLLETFKEPLNPSAAARKLGLPANRVHYHVKRLAAAGLLRTVSVNGRSRVYETVATRFRLRKSLLGSVAIALTTGAGDVLSGLRRGFVTAFEHFFNEAHREVNEGAEEYSILDLEAEPFKAYQPLVGAVEVRLSPEAYAQVVRAMTAAVETAERKAEGEGGETCTVAVVVYKGRMVPA